MAIPLYNAKFILLISASFITIFSSIAIYFCLPLLISHVIRNQISLSPGSGSFNDWRLNSVVDRMYLYNITNLDDLLSYHESAAAQRHSSSQQQHGSKPIPKLRQIGPFTFRQDREKINIKFDPANETVLYDQIKRWTFLPELSFVKTVEDLNSTWINHMNVPLTGTTLNSEYAEFIEPIIREFDLKLFLNHSVNMLLFEGYFDILMEQAKSSGQLDVDRFGWMHNLNNSITRGIRIFTGPSNATLDKFGAVDQYANTTMFSIWHNNGSEPKDISNVKCNEFRLSSAGEFFPPPPFSIISHNHYSQSTNNQVDSDGQISKKLDTTVRPQAESSTQASNISPSVELHDLESIVSKTIISRDGLAQDGVHELTTSKTGKTISLFMPDLCRTFTLTYNRTYDYNDLMVDRYIANHLTYDYTGRSESKHLDKTQSISTRIEANDNKCYCTYNENTNLTSCPPNGMMDLFNCRKGSPLTISFPHFLYYNNDDTLAPYLRLFDDEIQPSESEHQFYIDLESTLNVPVKAQIAIQFNVHYKNEPNLTFTRDYSFLMEDPKSSGKASKVLNDFYLPQMWFKSSAEIDEKNLRNLKFIQHHLKLVTPITTIIIFGFASILLMMSAKLAYDLTYGPTTSRKSI